MMWLKSGRLIDPLNIDMSKVEITDIAWALAHCNRWTGHADPPISVGLHSLVCAEAGAKYSALLGLLCLWHDSGEAFFNDMARDLKMRPEMAWYRKQEHRATQQLIDHFAPACRGASLRVTKGIDTASLMWERQYALPLGKDETDYHPEVAPLVPSVGVAWLVRDPIAVYERWLMVHDALTDRIYGTQLEA